MDEASKDLQLRPMSAPASGQPRSPTPLPAGDSSCSISIAVDNNKINNTTDNTSQGSSQGSSAFLGEELAVPAAAGGGARSGGAGDQVVASAAAAEGKQLQRRHHHHQFPSDGLQTEDSSEATRELFKLVTELSSDCRELNCESRGDCCRRLTGVSLETGLLYCNRECLKLKDFSSEVRASMDVEQFVHQAELMLDMREVSVENIVAAMLERVMANDRAPTSRLDEAKGVIFVPGSSMLLARTIQGLSYQVDSSGCPIDTSYDQSWLCAVGSLAQVSRRHMVVARFRQPTNMAENAHEVKLFALMVTPSKEKDTKSALETGRTFATMLTNVAFRKRLLDARNETEFKSLMMVRAQQLSKAKRLLKNRPKYMLGPALCRSISSLNNSNPESPSSLQQQSKGRCTTIGYPNDDKTTNNNNNNKLASSNDDINNNNNGNSGPQPMAGKFSSPGSLFSKNPRACNILELISQSNNPLDELAHKDPRDHQLHHYHNDNNLIKLPNGGGGGGKGNSCYNFGIALESLEFGKGLVADFRRRLRYYPSDFKDAFVGPPKTVQKTVATIWFLYFGILLPTIAFSALNTNQTHGHMGDLRKAIIGQAIGGLGFALFGGQPLVIIMTTAPLCLYTKDFGFHFPAMYAAVGLWNGVFLCIYSLFGFSRLMKWCTRSTEEIFALFIVIAFVSDASKDLVKNFRKYFYTPACDGGSGIVSNATELVSAGLSFNSTLQVGGDLESEFNVCRRETSLLFVLLMLGTLWLATTLYRFRKTPYLEAGKRELLADYALPAAVIAMSFVGSYIFDSIYVERFPPVKDLHLERAKVELLPLGGILTSLGLGFTLSLLFFMDQNISAAMVNAPQNGLKKGCAYHFDLLVVGILNGFLALYGFPMMHGVLPHSPLHVRSLADIEERVEEGHLREVIVNVRETRVTAIVSHILVLGSLYLIPHPIAYIPTAVLNGLFLYMAVTSLDGLQMFERILLLFTEQSKYPPNHYIRRCPQRKIHQFTMLQLFQLLIMCLFGFSPINIVEMFFPVIILLMIPFRHKIVPKYINERYLDALDGKH